MEPAGTSTAQSTVHRLIHGIAGGIIFLIMAIIPHTFLRAFKNDSRWRSMYGWTLASVVFLTITCISFTVTSKSPALQVTFYGWFGLIRRTALVLFMIWLFIIV